jgi:hypothetical protein
MGAQLVQYPPLPPSAPDAVIATCFTKAGTVYEVVPTVENVCEPDTTVTDAVLVALPPAPDAVNVYVLLAPGVTLVLPAAQETVPTPLSMLHAVAFAIPLQASVTESREPMVPGVPVNDAIAGAGAAAPTVTVAVFVALLARPFAVSV